MPGPSPFPAAPHPDPAAPPAQPLIPAFVTTCPGVRGTTASRSLQQHHKGCASPSAGASSVTGRSIPRANLKQVAGVPGGAVSTERSQMDYCSSCRRNLNGALVCPGCGAYAPDIAPPAPRLHSDVASTATARQAWRAEEVPAPGSYPGTHHSDAAPIGSGASEDAMADASGTGSSSGHEGTASTGQGRAARRRQLARWKKNKRRAVAATAVAIVGGGLTVAALPTTRPSTSHTHAASPPEPVTAATPRTATTDSAEQPDTPVSRHPSTRPPTTASRQQSTTAATPPTATTNRQPKSAATAPAPATSERNAAHHSRAGQGDARRQRRRPSLGPSPGDDRARCHRSPGAGTSAVNLLPTTSAGDPTSPTHVCLIGVCIG